MQNLIEKLNKMSAVQLSAIYNNCERKIHCESDIEACETVIAAIDFVCGLNNIEITGDSCQREFVEQGNE